MKCMPRALLAFTVVVPLGVSAAEPPPQAARDEAAAISQVAASKREAKDFALCAELYLRAATKDSSQPLYLYGEARCSQEEGERLAASPVSVAGARTWLLRAQGRYAAFLVAAADGEGFAAHVGEARKHQAVVAERLEAFGASRPASARAAGGSPAAVAESTEPASTPMWPLVAAGGCAVGAGVLAILAVSASNTAEEIRNDPKAAQTGLDSYDTQFQLFRGAAIAAGVTGVGLAAYGLLVRGSAASQVNAPTDGIAVSGFALGPRGAAALIQF